MLRRLLATFLSVSICFTQVFGAVANAQVDGPDFEAPFIDHEVSAGGLIGGVEVFRASVVDNDELASVQLFFRYESETEYTRVNMRRVSGSSEYTARVVTSSADDNTTGIEYYIRAEDVAGNLVLKGFAFQPLLRSFSAAPVSELPAQASGSATVETPEVTGGKINWLYVALGVLVVGGIAASAGGGGGGTPSPADCTGGCTVTVTAQPPSPD